MRSEKSTTARRLIKSTVEALPAPTEGYAVCWDDRLRGFALRISERGTRTYFVQSRLPDGRQVKIKIGRHGAITAEQARERARQLLGAISAGADPAKERRSARLAEKERRGAPTVSDLLDRYLKEHAERRKRPSSVESDKILINRHIRPALGASKVALVTHADVERLHRAISGTAPIAANRAVAVLSKAMGLAVRWGWRVDNPCKGVERNPEERRERFLTVPELGRLCEALSRRQGSLEAACITIMMLTGCRRGEALTARWRDFDPAQGVWSKPASTTKQRKGHRVPLSAAARAVLLKLAEQFMPEDPPPDAFVVGGPAMVHRLRAAWEDIRKEAGLPGLRLHDLRHGYASLLASGGLSLPIIGALLGHASPATTARYAHLLDDPLRQATERVGGLWQALSERSDAEVVQLRPGGRG